MCAEEIQDDALKCKHCGEYLTKPKSKEWYFKTTFVILMFLCVGPFALPLVWFNPALKMRTKVIVTVVAGVVTYYSFVMTLKALATLKTYYHQISEMYQ
jgi:hypothetical protein